MEIAFYMGKAKSTSFGVLFVEIFQEEGRDMGSNQIISQNLIISQMQAKSWQIVIQELGGKLQQNGYVKESYIKAVIEREGNFPTGLPLGVINVAIPHTDVEHVIEPAIAVATLAQPVLFGNMGEQGNMLEVSVVFLLAMKEPHAQVGLLQSLVSAFQNPEVLQSLLQAESESEIKAILQEKVIEEVVDNAEGH
jgi:PTS system galactitol-specific IIA component